MTDPIFEGVYGTYTIDATDRREVLGYRLALTAVADASSSRCQSSVAAASCGGSQV